MTFRINRLYYLKTKAFARYLGVLLLFFALAGAWSIYSKKAIGSETIVAMLLIIALYVYLYLRRFPKQFEVSDGEVVLWMRLKKALPSGVHINHTNWYYKKLFMTVCRVQRIEFSFAEDRSVGTVRLYGEIRTQTKSGEYVDPIDPPSYIELAGIRSFPHARACLMQAFPQAEYRTL